MSRASEATSTRALQYARTIATLAGEQIRIRIASSASIWLSAGTARRTAPPPGAVSGVGRLPSHAERLTSQGAARGACRSSTRRRSRTRTACAGASATNSSISAASPSVRPPSGAKRASPIVAPATHADHRPARSSETSNLKLAGAGWSALNAGTRWRAARRGRHTGSSTTASSPSRRGAGAASTSRRHAGGTTSARALDGHPEAATKRSVGMGGNRRDRRGRGREGSRPRHPLVVVAQAWLRVPVQTGIKGLQTRAPLVPLASSGRRGYWVRWEGLHPPPPGSEWARNGVRDVSRIAVPSVYSGPGPASSPEAPSPRSSAQSRVEHIAQRVAEHVEAEDSERDGHSGPHRHPRRAEHVRTARAGEHRAPRREGRRHAEAEERERRLRQGHGPGPGRGPDDDRRRGVGQDMAGGGEALGSTT